MERKVLIVCDPEEDYVRHMADFLCRKQPFWEIRVYTKPEELEKTDEAVEILLMAESVYVEYEENVHAKVKILLREDGLYHNEKIAAVDKYQSADKVWQEILLYYMESTTEAYTVTGGYEKAKLIGMYSPVKRCLQSTFALTYSQLMAEKHRTLYISFEHYSGMQEWQEYKRQDLSALLYVQQNKKESFSLQMQTLIGKMGNLDFVMPMINGENMLLVTFEEWRDLLQSIMNCGIYECVVLDLCESMRGLFEILRMCTRIYTIVREDRCALYKIQQYEQLLQLQRFEDIKEKTRKCHLPVFRKLPGQIEEFTRGELAEYVRDLLRREGEYGVSGMETATAKRDTGEAGLW